MVESKNGTDLKASMGMEMCICGRELVVAREREDVEEEWKKISGEPLRVMQDMVDNPLAVEQDPICRQVTKVKAFTGSMSVFEALEANLCLMIVTTCVNGNVSLQFLVDTGASYNVIHENTVDT